VSSWPAWLHSVTLSQKANKSDSLAGHSRPSETFSNSSPTSCFALLVHLRPSSRLYRIPLLRLLPPGSPFHLLRPYPLLLLLVPPSLVEDSGTPLGATQGGSISLYLYRQSPKQQSN
jgi:hypothetical protein